MVAIVVHGDIYLIKVTWVMVEITILIHPYIFERSPGYLSGNGSFSY